MSKEMAVIALGVLVVVTPYLGIPGSWKTFILVIAGAALAGLGFLLRGESLSRAGTAGQGDRHFVENSAPSSAGRTDISVVAGSSLTQSKASRDHGIGSLN